MRDLLNWFEIPVTDIERAAKFYSAVFDIHLTIQQGDGFSSAIFPHNGGAGGGLVAGEGYQPNSQGSLLYLNANPDVQNILDKIEAAGGKILVPKTEISPDYGHMAVFLDTEGNRIALHSVPPGM